MSAPPPARRGDAGRFILLIVIVALGAGGAAFAMMEGRRESKVSPAAARLAVLPLAAPPGDTALGRLGRDLAATVAATLAQVRDVHTVDTAVIRGLAGGHALDAPAAESLGRALGASAYVFGAVDADGPRVRVVLKLRSITARGPAAEIVTGGPRSDYGVLSDSVTWALLRRLYRGHNMPLPSLGR